MKPAVFLALSTGFFLSGLFNFQPGVSAAEIGDPSRQYDGVAPASDEGEKAIKSFVIPKGLEVELVAAEPLLANPVAFSIDEHGNFYVVEAFRHGAGVLDIRGRRGWPKEDFREGISQARIDNLANEVLDMDLAVRTTDGRVGYLKNYFGNDAASITGAADRVRKIWDSNGDGILDKASVFTEGFGNPEDGLGSGVLAKDGYVWYTDIPYLWRTQDTDGDGVADERRTMFQGFGVRTGFLGHDMHGLEFGPDGKLYFTIGDRAASVAIGGGRKVDMPDTGAVFRCYPDGSDLEVFAFGLRNPQELTFDQHGNLFTGDNNSDGGDEARWVHLVEGGDSGWRIGYQFFERSDAIYHEHARGPWNAEKIWHPQNDVQPAHIIPPIINLGNGPSGITFYPGTGLSEMWNGQFFMVDFKGQASISGVHTFDLMPNGAGFKIGYQEHFIWNILATDIEFGVDGGVYVSDWVSGWNKTGKGRIYRVFDPALEDDPRILETKKYLGEGMANRSNRQLERLLAFQDYRVRLDAQFELARRGDKGIRYLASAARQTKQHLARLHGVWGLGQILDQFRGQIAALETRETVVKTLVGLLNDENARVRGQSAKVLGDGKAQEAFDGLIKLTKDSDANVRFHAVMSLGKLNRLEAIPAILNVIRENNDEDPVLRHAGVMALTGLLDIPTLQIASKDESAAIRMASLLAMRRLHRDDIEVFLLDSDPKIVREAARAINDEPIDGATLKLAALEPGDWNDFIVSSRIVNANLRGGTMTHAKRLAGFGANTKLPEPVRQDALLALADWANPSGRDRVTGVWRPFIASSRDSVVPATALRPIIASVLEDDSEKVRLAAIEGIVSLQISEAADPLLGIVGEESNPERVRVAALKALDSLGAAELDEAVKLASASGAEKLMGAASDIRARGGSGDVLAEIEATLASGSISARQLAIGSLAQLKSAEADAFIQTLLEKLREGQIADEIALDVLEVARERENKELARIAEALIAEDASELGAYRFSTVGGNAENGDKLFHEREDVACLRCHQVGGTGGEVGPHLEGIASRVSTQHILEAIVQPNKEIAAGFENVMVETKDGDWYAGMIKSDTDAELVINSPEDGIITVPKSDIKTRERGASGMPEGMGLILTKKELRDVIAYLQSLK